MGKGEDISSLSQIEVREVAVQRDIRVRVDPLPTNLRQHWQMDRRVTVTRNMDCFQHTGLACAIETGENRNGRNVFQFEIRNAPEFLGLYGVNHSINLTLNEMYKQNYLAFN